MLRKKKQEDEKSMVILIYIVSSSLAWDTWDTISKCHSLNVSWASVVNPIKPKNPFDVNWEKDHLLNCSHLFSFSVFFFSVVVLSGTDSNQMKVYMTTGMINKSWDYSLTMFLCWAPSPNLHIPYVEAY